MKKIISCLAILAMISAMVSCGDDTSSEITEVQITTTKPSPPPKYPEETEAAEPVVIDADSYLGQWSGGKNSITIEKSDEGYTADIEWVSGGGAFLMNSHLHYKCEFNESDSTMICSEGVLKQIKYEEDGTTSETQIYDDGTAIMKIDTNTYEWLDNEVYEYYLTWLDDKDDSFSDVIFLK